MRSELDDLLCQGYPDLFRDRHGDRADTSMCWGFCCGDGWYGILDELCAAITSQVRQRKMPPVVVSQVKEKFGALRFHIVGGLLRGGNAETHRLIAAACQQALTTCEQCGAAGEMVGAGVKVVLCPKCTNERFELDVSL